MEDEVDCLHADKHENLIQIDAMILMGMARIPIVPKIAMSLQYLKEEVRDEVYFCM